MTAAAQSPPTTNPPASPPGNASNGGQAAANSAGFATQEQSASQPRLWQRQLLGDFYALHVVGSASQAIDGMTVSPLLGASELPSNPQDVRLGGYAQQRPAPAEFRADRNDAPGGLGTWISPSGKSSWHGQFYGIPRMYFLQPSASDSGGAIRYKSNQYGGNAGGPIRKNSLFVYADYLGLDQQIERWLEGYVPAAELRAQIAIDQPELSPIMNAYPHGGRSDSPGILAFRSAGTQTHTDKIALLRLDHAPASLSAKAASSWYGRFNMAFVDNQAPLGGNDGYLRDLAIQRNHPLSVVFAWARPTGANQVLDVQAAWLRGSLDSQVTSPLRLPYAVVIPGLTFLNGRHEVFGATESFAVKGSVNRTWRLHQIASGAELRHVQIGLHLTDFGRVNFASLAAFTSNDVSTATYNQAVPPNTLTQWQDSAWLQDSWEIRPNLRVGGGLRYDIDTTLQAIGDKAKPFDFITCGDAGFCRPGAPFNRVTGASLDPRLSIAWTPSAGPDWVRSKMVLRAGAAIYHANGLLMDQTQPVYNEVQAFSLSSTPSQPLTFPLTRYLTSTAPGVLSARGMSRQRHNPYAAEWALSLQTQITPRWSATGTWFGASGVHLPTSTYVNLIVPRRAVRPYPAFGQIGYLENTSSSILHAFTLTGVGTVPGRGQIMAGYNWAHEIDNGASSDIGADAPQNPGCLRCERASGDLDVRHLGGVRTYNPLPIPLLAAQRSGARWINRVAENWSVLNDFYGTSALPVNVSIDRPAADVPTGYTIRQRPDRVPGVSIRPRRGPSVSQWLNPAAFTTVHGIYGTTPRNVARAPAQWALSSGLGKDLILPKKIHANLMFRVQNVLNHANYAQPLSDWSAPQFGRIVNPYSPGLGGDTGPRSFFVDIALSR